MSVKNIKKIVKYLVLFVLMKKLWDIARSRQAKSFFRSGKLPFLKKPAEHHFSVNPVISSGVGAEKEKEEFWDAIKDFLKTRKISAGIFLITILGAGILSAVNNSLPLLASLTDISEVSTPKEIEKEIARAKKIREKVERKEEARNPENLEIITNSVYRPGHTKIVQIRAHIPEIIGTNGIQMTSTLRDLAKITPSVLTQKDFKDGRAYIFLKTDSTRTFRIIATGIFGEKKSQPLQAQVFEDVSPRNDPYAEAIKYLKDRGIAQGFDNGRFQPGWELYRVEALTMLLRANRIKPEEKHCGFEDVPSEVWFNGYIAAALDEKMIDPPGADNLTFDPSRPVSRAAFLKMALQAFGFEGTKVSGRPYSDVPEGAWFAPYFAFARKNNLIEEEAQNQAHPGANISRGQAAHIIYELSKIEVL